MRLPVVVVGAGIGGLSAAMHLRGDGHDVIVVEASDVPGGRAGVRQVDGFRFDTGPTVVTMPHLLRRTFAAVDSDMDDFITLDRLDPAYAAHFADGSRLEVAADHRETRASIDALAGPAEAVGYDRFRTWIGDLYDIEFDRFIDRDLVSVLSMLRSSGALIELARHGGFSRWSSAVDRFFDDDRCRRLFSFQALYAGISPTEALGLLAVIAHMDTELGVYTARGGVHAVTVAMASAAEKAGIQMIYGRKVSHIDNTMWPPGSIAGSTRSRSAPIPRVWLRSPTDGRRTWRPAPALHRVAMPP